MTTPLIAAATASAPYIFLSYRRDDALAAARRIMWFLHEQYGVSRVFMDIAEIRDAARWPKAIDNALERATVLIPVIGRDWLTVETADGGRRIEQEDDWVRKEIAFALDKGIDVIPIFIGIRPFESEALPMCLRELANRHGRVIMRDTEFEAQLRQLCDALQLRGFPPLKEQTRFPTPWLMLKPLTQAELDTALATLPGWRLTGTPLPGKEHVVRSELNKTFEFATFRRAMEFMYHASFHMTKVVHHVRWTNVWHTVEVWLCTWDIQFQVSTLDIEMATYLDQLAKAIRATPKMPPAPDCPFISTPNHQDRSS
jgi:pterin-4a-carbinolamine dehydratase